MKWLERKIYLYNVTFGLYMLDWWERGLFNILVLMLMWYVCYNGGQYLTALCQWLTGNVSPTMPNERLRHAPFL